MIRNQVYSYRKYLKYLKFTQKKRHYKDIVLKKKKKKNQTSANISKRAEKKYEYQTSLQSFEKVISKETRR